MFEVHSGSRAGRPVALLLVSGVVLAGALTLAWVQVRASCRLGPEVAIPNTPLRVRPPQGWQPHPRDPSSFVLPVRRAVRGQERWEIDRRISFGFHRLPAYRPPLEWLAEVTRSTGLDPEPARIGPFEAVQVRQVERRPWGRQVLIGQSIIRVAILPAGQVITVVYVPMMELTLADLKLLDKVCHAVRVEEPGLAVTPAEARQHAGVEFPFEANWQAALPFLRQVPGFFVGGSVDGLPAWSLGVFRTWLAAGRRPGDLLRDFAACLWLLPDENVVVREQQRADGATLAAVHHPDLPHNRQAVAAVWAVGESPSEAVVLLLYTSPRYFPAAEAIAARVARQVDIRPIDAIPDVSAAEAAGVELATLLTKLGAVPWWGAEEVQLQYAGTTVRGDEFAVVHREALGRDPIRGYKGHRQRRITGKHVEQTFWELGRRAISYRVGCEEYTSDGLAVNVREFRAPRAEVVTRVVTFNDVEQQRRAFRPGPSFVCPPIESIAEAWVARESTIPCINESSTLLGRGAHSRLLRPLAPQDGYLRVLLQDDFQPFGVVLAFDEGGDLEYQLDATARYERVR